MVRRAKLVQIIEFKQWRYPQNMNNLGIWDIFEKIEMVQNSFYSENNINVVNNGQFSSIFDVVDGYRRRNILLVILRCCHTFLVTVLTVFVTNILYHIALASGFWSKFCHQHPRIFTKIKSPTSIWHQHLFSPRTLLITLLNPNFIFFTFFSFIACGSLIINFELRSTLLSPYKPTCFNLIFKFWFFQFVSMVRLTENGHTKFDSRNQGGQKSSLEDGRTIFWITKFASNTFFICQK